MGGSREQVGRNCPYCGAIIRYDEFFCRACHKRITDQQDFDSASAVRPEKFVVSPRSPVIAGALSLISPGLGQFYNGETLKGLVFFLSFVVVSFGMIPWDLLVTFYSVFFFGIWILGIADAAYSAWQITHFIKPCTTGASYGLYVLLALFLLIAALHLFTGQPDTIYLGKLFPLVSLWSG